MFDNVKLHAKQTYNSTEILVLLEKENDSSNILNLKEKNNEEKLLFNLIISKDSIKIKEMSIIITSDSDSKTYLNFNELDSKCRHFLNKNSLKYLKENLGGFNEMVDNKMNKIKSSFLNIEFDSLNENVQNVFIEILEKYFLSKTTDVKLFLFLSAFSENSNYLRCLRKCKHLV